MSTSTSQLFVNSHGVVKHSQSVDQSSQTRKTVTPPDRQSPKRPLKKQVRPERLLRSQTTFLIKSLMVLVRISLGSTHLIFYGTWC